MAAAAAVGEPKTTMNVEQLRASIARCSSARADIMAKIGQNRLTIMTLSGENKELMLESAALHDKIKAIRELIKVLRPKSKAKKETEKTVAKETEKETEKSVAKETEKSVAEETFEDSEDSTA